MITRDKNSRLLLLLLCMVDCRGEDPVARGPVSLATIALEVVQEPFAAETYKKFIISSKANSCHKWMKPNFECPSVVSTRLEAYQYLILEQAYKLREEYYTRNAVPDCNRVPLQDG